MKRFGSGVWVQLRLLFVVKMLGWSFSILSDEGYDLASYEVADAIAQLFEDAER